MDRLTEETMTKLAKALHAAFQPNRTEIVIALRSVATFNPHMVPVQFDSKSGHSVYGKTSRKDVVDELAQDARQPFFSEAYLYNLLGKDDARTLLARFHALCLALGVDDAVLFGDDEAEIDA